MTQADIEERLLVCQINDLTIDSVQYDVVDNKASDASLQGSAQRIPSNVSDLRSKNTFAQITEDRMIEGNNEPRAETTTKYKKKRYWSSGARKERRRWKEEQGKQIALGIHSKEEIPAVVDAARKKAKRQYRKEQRLQKTQRKEAEKNRISTESQAGSVIGTSSDRTDEDSKSSYEAQLPSQMANMKLDEGTDMETR